MDTYTDGMTLDEQIGQLLMVGFWGITPSQEIIELIRHHHVGNILLFSRNVRDARQVLELTRSLQSIAQEAGQRYPLLIAIDQENGIVQRLGDAATILPGNMALGAAASEDLAYRVALATGRELQALGINMNLAPVVDVNNNPANPVIGVRSFGEDAHQVARLGAAMVKGYHDAAIICCLKHFPGHGDTAVDSHLALPIIAYTLERLETLELLPFKSGIEAGAESVMIAHVSFPVLNRSAPIPPANAAFAAGFAQAGLQEEHMLPATLSPAIVQGLLREQAGFNGVILSDCLEMRAISETFGTQQAAVMALQAGIDLVLVSHHYLRQQASIAAIQAAVQAHELSPQTVQQAAERVLALKARLARRIDYAHQFPSPNLDELGREAHIALQSQAYELSTTLVRNEDGLLPLSATDTLVLLSPQRNANTMVEDRYYSDDVLADILARYHPRVRILPVAQSIVDDDYRKLLQTTAAADVFIVATVNAHLDEQQAQLVRYLVAAGRRVIVIAVRNPYDLLVFPQLRTYLATYEYTRPALTAAVRVLFGARQAQGHLPVSIPGLYPRVLHEDN